MNPSRHHSFRILHTLLIALTLLTALPAQAGDIYVPSPEPADRFRPSHTQRMVRRSTDVLLIAMPVATLAGALIARDWKGIGQGAAAAATTFAVTEILKLCVHERRPDRSNYHSFPSGHTSLMFANAAFLQRRYGWAVGAPAYALATYTAWGRVFARKHHWWDCAAGAAIGVGCSYIFTRPFARRHQLTVAPYTDGDNFSVTASMVF